MPPKLVLYSDQASPLSDSVDTRLSELLPSGCTVGYLPAAPDPERRFFLVRERHYERLGFSLRFFGLEDEFQPKTLAELLQLDAIHLSGGNTFRFLHWLRVRGLLPAPRSYVAGGGVLIGMSAGAILMTPDVGSAAICGDTPYAPLSDSAGLGLVDFAILPHFDGSDAHRAALAQLGKRVGGVAYGLPDGSGIVVNESRVELIGPVTSCEPGSTAEGCDEPRREA